MIYKLEALTERLTGVHIADEGHLENTIQLPPFDPVQEEVHMIILTAPDGHNSGRAYVHHLPPDSAQRWFDYLTRYVRKAKRREHTRQLDQQFGTNKFLRYRALAREMYESTPFQLFIAFLIVSSFACDIGDAQFLPSDGSTLSKFFQRVDISITVLFLLELLLNLFAHSNDWFKPFYSSVANWFDVFIVMVSLISLGLTFGSALPDAKLLRLLRLGRMVRMMQSFKSLHEEEDGDDATQAQTTSCEGLLGELIQKFDQQQRTLEEQGAQLETLKHLLHRSVVSIRDPHQPPSVLDSLHLQRPRAIPQELPQGTSEGQESPRDRSTDVSAALMRARNRFYLLSTPGKT